MIELYHNSYRHVLHLDWLKFSIVPSSEDLGSPKQAVKRLLQWFGTLPEHFQKSDSCKSPWYENSFGGVGWRVFYEPKKGTKNYYAEVELTGKWFSGWGVDQIEQTNKLLYAIYTADCGIVPSRVDAALDAFRPISRSRLLLQSSFMSTSYRSVTSSGKRKITGCYAGKGDFRYVIYDKIEERITKGASEEVQGIDNWWRYEVQVSGNGLRNQFSMLPCQVEYLDLMTIGVLSMGNKVTVYPEWLQTVPKMFCEGQLERYVKKNSTYEGAIRWIDQRLCKLARDNVARIFQRFEYEVSAGQTSEVSTPFDVMEYLEKDNTPPIE